MSIEENEEKKKDMLTVPEAAAEANLDQTTIRNAIYRGRLAATNIYGRPIIERGEFERYRAATKMGRPAKKKQDAADSQDKPTEH